MFTSPIMRLIINLKAFCLVCSADLHRLVDNGSSQLCNQSAAKITLSHQQATQSKSIRVHLTTRLSLRVQYCTVSTEGHTFEPFKRWMRV